MEVKTAVESRDGEEPLRLELMLDLMARDLPSKTLVGVYSLVLGRKPTLPHFALAAAGCPIVTTNQDELIELAASELGRAADVLHLHGLASDPDSIVTTLSKYVEGLSETTERDFRLQVSGRHLIVVGYSGRDRDVMPILHSADRITWLNFEPPGGGASLATEVLSLAEALGPRMRVIEHPSPQEWLIERLTQAARRQVIGFEIAASSSRTKSAEAKLSPAIEDEFRRLSLVGRRLAVGRVLIHVDQSHGAYEGLRRAARSHRDDPRLPLEIADALTVLQRRPQALRSYSRAIRLSTVPEFRASALLGSAGVLANGGKYAEALVNINKVELEASKVRNARSRRSLQARSAALTGRIYAGTDNERAASREYRRSARLAKMNGDLDTRTTALVFGSDLLRSRGLYHKALEQLAIVFDDNELYTRPFTRVWGHFYRGQTLCATGLLDQGLQDLERCKVTATITGNQQAIAWASLALGSFRRIRSISEVDEQLYDCEAAMEAYGGGLVLCATRLAWERAELDRARGNHAASLSKVASLRSKINDRTFPAKLPYMEPHLSSIEAEIARDEGSSEAISLLRKARAGYSLGGWGHGAARLDVSLWLARGTARPPTQLVDRCTRAGYGFEVERLKNRKGGYYALLAL
jgi:tetratricopeptide (TPR) repeat protein